MRATGDIISQVSFRPECCGARLRRECGKSSAPIACMRSPRAHRRQFVPIPLNLVSTAAIGIQKAVCPVTIIILPAHRSTTKRRWMRCSRGLLTTMQMGAWWGQDQGGGAGRRHSDSAVRALPLSPVRVRVRAPTPGHV